MTDPYRVLVTGSREYDDYDTMCIELGHVLVQQMALHGMSHPPIVVVHGAARGADALAERAARAFGMKTDPRPADWDAPCRPECKPGHRRKRGDGSTYCPAAGNYRNQEMVNRGASLTLAFYQQGAANRGTSDCVERAETAGIPVRRVTDG